MEAARRYLAEFVGTFALVFIGTFVVAVGGERLGGGAATVVIAAFGHGLILMAMVYALGAVSGAHVNPAVTIGVLAVRKISVPDAAGYIIFQLLGAVVAVLLHAAILSKGVTSYGLTTPAPDVSDGAAVLLEAVLTFFLVTADSSTPNPPTSISRCKVISSSGLWLVPASIAATRSSVGTTIGKPSVYIEKGASSIPGRFSVWL